MAEHEEHPAEGTTPERGEEAPPAPAAEQPPAAAAHPHEGATPPPAGTTPYATAAPAPAAPGRFRRWSANAGLRMGAVAVVAGLVGGLVGGGIVAAFSDDGHDRSGPVRLMPGMQRGGPNFRVPRYYGQQPNRMPQFRRGVPQPGQPATPAPPAPSPKSSG
jgi:hypothetical protein